LKDKTSQLEEAKQKILHERAAQRTSLDQMTAKVQSLVDQNAKLRDENREVKELKEELRVSRLRQKVLEDYVRNCMREGEVLLSGQSHAAFARESDEKSERASAANGVKDDAMQVDGAPRANRIKFRARAGHAEASGNAINPSAHHAAPAAAAAAAAASSAAPAASSAANPAIAPSDVDAASTLASFAAPSAPTRRRKRGSGSGSNSAGPHAKRSKEEANQLIKRLERFRAALKELAQLEPSVQRQQIEQREAQIDSDWHELGAHDFREFVDAYRGSEIKRQFPNTFFALRVRLFLEILKRDRNARQKDLAECKTRNWFAKMMSTLMARWPLVKCVDSKLLTSLERTSKERIVKIIEEELGPADASAHAPADDDAMDDEDEESKPPMHDEVNADELTEDEDGSDNERPSGASSPAKGASPRVTSAASDRMDVEVSASSVPPAPPAPRPSSIRPDSALAAAAARTTQRAQSPHGDTASDSASAASRTPPLPPARSLAVEQASMAQARAEGGSGGGADDAMPDLEPPAEGAAAAAAH
jgi:hypothetical protein